MRDRPSVFWLVLAALVSLVHPFVPESRWLMVHLVMLGAVTHSVLVWSTHFAQALLKTPDDLDPRRRQSARLGLLMAGVSLVVIGVPTTWWPLTVTGATLVAAAVLWHAAMLWRRTRHALPGRFRITIHAYLAAAATLPVGATFGVLLARGPAEEWYARLLLAHSLTMVLGWLALTVTGTLVTLWPTMLRTRIHPEGERYARATLPIFGATLTGAVVSTLLGAGPALAGFLFGYVAALVVWAIPLVKPAIAAPPRQFSVWSAAAAVGWLSVAVIVLAWRATHEPLTQIADAYGAIASMVVVGFGLQVVMGALSYLIPTVLGGGTRPVRAARERLDRYAAARFLLVNLGLALCLVPVPSIVRVIVSVIVLLALAAFLPLLLLAIRDWSRTRRELAEAGGRSANPLQPVGPERSAWSNAQAVAALSVLALAVATGIAADPESAGFVARGDGVTATGAGGAAGAAVPATGQTTTIKVTARDMRYTPARIEVPAGNRLVIELTNTDPTTVHDLTFGGGVSTERLQPNQSATLDVGVVGATTQGWCTVIGHRRMGMVLDVVATGTPPAGSTVAAAGQPGAAGPAGAAGAAGQAGEAAEPHGGEHAMPGMPGMSGMSDTSGAGTGVHADDAAPQQVIDPVLPKLTDERVHKTTFTVQEVELEVAPGVRQKRWTFNGRAPGPTLRGRVGDVFEITLVNDGSMGHSIDFHAGALAPDRPMRTIAPGESLTYRFTAKQAGIWMYHCSTMPMSAHIAAGMHGAVVIEPAGLPQVDRSYLLVQSEAYVAGDGRSQISEVDADAVSSEQPDFVVFNGIANQYDHAQLAAKVGERVRIWLLDAGPNRPTSFHIVGGQFDTVYAEGAYQLRGPGAAKTDGGSQALALQPAQGGFVELTFPEAGHYPAVSHIMVDAERGAHAIVKVTD